MTDQPTENLPAVRTEAPVTVVRRADTDSWAQQLPAIVDLARSICGTDFVPEALRDNVAATAAAILYGRELGIPPLTALSNVHVIKGTPALSARMQRAQVLAAGHGFRVIESTMARAVVEGRRKGDEGPWTRVSYDFEEAKRAGSVKRDGNWEKSPADMCFARASARLCRRIFADVILGLPTPEELEDEPDIAAGATVAAASTTKVQRTRKTTQTTPNGAPVTPPATSDDGPAAAAPAGAGPSSPPPPPLPGEPGYETSGGPGVDLGQGKAPVPGPSPQTGGGSADGAGSGPGRGSVQDPPPQTDDGASARPAPPHGPDDATGSLAPSSPSSEGEKQEAGDEAELVDTAKPASRAILRALKATFNRLGLGGEEDHKTRLGIISAITGEEITTTSEINSELSHEGARKASQTLARLDTKADVMRLMNEIAKTGEVPE